MAVRNTAVSGLKSLGIIFKQHGLAHKYLDGLKGIELGAAAHNPFGLQGSVNVAPEDDFEFYKAEQVKMCGAYAEVETRWLSELPVSQFVDGIGLDISWLTEGFPCEHWSTACPSRPDG